MFDHTAVIAAETERFATAVTAADPTATVPTCPEWTAADLLWHLTETHAFWARILGTNALTDADSEAIEADQPQRPDDPSRIPVMLTEETADLIAQLDRRANDEPAWSWFGSDQTVGFTRRMQVHEAVLHRVDAELVAGRPVTEVDPEVARAGIVHAVDVMYAWWGTLPGFSFSADGGPVLLRLTDGDDLMLQPGRWRGVGESGRSYDEPGVLRVAEDDSVTAVAVVTGSAWQLDRWLWGRGEEPPAEGDAAALGALRAMIAAGIQ